MGLHKPIAVLNKLVKQNLIIADAICPDPYFEEGGRPYEMNMIALGFDPVLMDVFAAEVLGYRKEDISYLMMAEKMGVGSFGPYEKVEHDLENKGFDEIRQPEEKYLNLIDEAGAFRIQQLGQCIKAAGRRRLMRLSCGQHLHANTIGIIREKSVWEIAPKPVINIRVSPEQDEIYIYLKVDQRFLTLKS